jgi:hypothetical protein
MDDLNGAPVPSYHSYGTSSEESESDEAASISHDVSALENARRAGLKRYVNQSSVQSLAYLVHSSLRSSTHVRPNRSCLQKNVSMYTEWDRQLPILTDAYLAWKHGGASEPSDLDANSHQFEVKRVGIDSALFLLFLFIIHFYRIYRFFASLYNSSASG